MNHTRLRRFSMLMALLVVALGPAIPARGQTPAPGWSTPVRLFEGTGSISEPALVADPTGVVHAFWYYTDVDPNSVNAANPVRETGYLYHAAWDGEKWSEPRDILAVENQAAGLTAAADSNYWLHLFWRGEDYSRSVTTRADSARGWPAPASVGGTAYHGALAVDGNGDLFMAYGDIEARGLYLRRVSTSGQVSVEGNLIAPTVNSESMADWVRLAVGPDGALHAVWTEERLPNAWPPLGVYYARSADGGRTWSTPVEIAGQGYDQINIAVGTDNKVYVAWNGSADLRGGRFYRWSADGGLNWSNTQPIIPAGLGGTDGYPDLLFDSAGVLHFITNVGHGCVLYAEWRGGGWSTPQCVTPPGSDVDMSKATISSGNRLHVLFRPWAGKQLWYTGRTVNAPAAAPRPSPTVAPAPAPAQAATAGKTLPTPIPEDLALVLRDPVEPVTGPGGPIELGFAAVALLLVVLVAAVGIRRRAAH